MDIIDYKALSNGIVFCRDLCDKLTRSHSSLRFTYAISYHKDTEKVYLYQGPSSLPHLSTKTRKKKFHNEYIMCYQLGIYCLPLPPSLSPSFPHNTYSFIIFILNFLLLLWNISTPPPLYPRGSFEKTLMTTSSTPCP